MSLLAHLLSPQNVLLDVEAGNKRRLFEAVAFAAEAQYKLSPMATVESLLAREKLGSTGLGQGIAIPHGRIRGLDHAIGYFVRPKEAIVFEAPDRQPVRDIFVLLVPEAATDEHLQILSELAQKFSNKGFREALAQAASGESIYALFSAD